MSAREEIQAAAQKAGWTRADLWGNRVSKFINSGEGADEFTKDTKPDDLLATMIAAGNLSWTPRLRVVVYYGINSQVTDAFLQTPKQQSLMTGDHSEHEARTEGPGRKQQVLSWLQWGRS